MTTVQAVVLMHHVKTNGTCNIKFKITHNGTSAYISSGIITERVKFKRGKTTGIITDEEVKRLVEERLNKIRAVLFENENTVSQLHSAKEVKEFLENYVTKKRQFNFFTFYNKFIQGIENQSTRAYHITRMNAFRDFVLQETGTDHLPFGDISVQLLNRYEQWLRTTNRRSKKANRKRKGLNSNSIHSYITALSTVFNAARKTYSAADMRIENNPFQFYTRPRIVATKKRALSKEVIRDIYYHKTRKPTPRMTKDLFMLSFFFAGMNLADIYDCGRFGKRLEYTRKKTRNHKREAPFISLPIHPLAAEIVRKYKCNDGVHGFIFAEQYDSIQSLHQAIRRGLQVLRKELGIPDLTYYAARHSFATIARNECDVSMDDIALCLTHESGHKITDTYIKADCKRIDAVITKVIKAVFG